MPAGGPCQWRLVAYLVGPLSGISVGEYC